MTNKQKVAILFTVVSCAAAFAILKMFFPHTDAKYKQSQEVDQSLTARIEGPGASLPLLKNEVTNPDEKVESIRTALKKCFPSVDHQTLDPQSIIKFLENNSNLSNQVIEQEQYDLINKSDEKFVVQVIASEEEKEKVRLFSINNEDGLPDRIKDYRGAGESELVKRIESALSVGTVVKKTETIRQTGSENDSLVFEKANDEIISISYSKPGLEFTCKQGDCRCDLR